jgi:hypothetical protein
MYSDDALALTAARRSLEEAGLKWTGSATRAELYAALVDLNATSAAVNRSLLKRIEALEKQTGGMQKALDHVESHALMFRGDWQTSANYQPGTVVRHRGGVFTALRQILPGKAEPGRDGSGWDRIL